MKVWAWVLLAVFLLLDAGAVYKIQLALNEARKGNAVEEKFGMLPASGYLKAVSLGYDSMLADLIWLKVVQVMGEDVVPRDNAKWIYHSVDVATDLDPKFDYMYQAGGIYLASVMKEYDLGGRLLRKGFDNNPTVWQLPFYTGVNYFLNQGEYKRAAYYMGRAAELPGRPPFVPLLATRLYAEAGDPTYALELVGHILDATEDEKVKSALRQRMKELEVEVNLNAIEDAARKFHDKFRRYPAGVSELVGLGYLRGYPKDQLGGGYIIDTETGEARNTALKRRLRIFPR